MHGQNISEIYYDGLKIEKENLTNFLIKKENNDIIQLEENYESTSAIDYYIQGYIFTKWVQENLGEIKQSDSIDGKTGNKLRFSINKTLNNENIFKIGENNIPESRNSIFFMHKEAVIRKKIEEILIQETINFKNQLASNYEFALPKLKETDWEKVINNVGMTCFVHGLLVNGKNFNNYAVVASNVNFEYINANDLYFLCADGNYHLANCKELINKQLNDENFIIVAYAKSNLMLKKLEVNEISKSYYYYSQLTNNNNNYNNCYNCIVGMANLYNFEDVINGEIKDKSSNVLYNKENLKNLRKVYFTSLAREKYNNIVL